MEALYDQLRRPLPDDYHSAKSVTLQICLTKLKPEFKLSPEIVSALTGTNAPILIHTIACTSWACQGVVRINIKSNHTSKSKQDSFSDLQEIYACIESKTVQKCTDVFHTGHDFQARHVYLHRVDLVSMAQKKVPEITLDIAKAAFTENEGNYVIPKSSPIGILVAASWSGVEDSEPNYVLPINDSIPQLDDAEGREFARQTIADIKSTVKPMDLSLMTLTAAGYDEGWRLDLRLVIVFRVAP